MFIKMCILVAFIMLLIKFPGLLLIPILAGILCVIVGVISALLDK
jgi:hypothetical protein